ncbi:MAG: copper resistance protein CopC/CopD [Catenulispora sp.]|nr:copper resistance protein CopC/CopD [Catenulispora sp.]
MTGARPHLGATTARRSFLTVLVCAAFCLLAGLLAAPGAQAHAELVSSDPPDGTHLTAVPQQVTLTFSEEVTVAQCAVQADGKPLPVHGEAGHPEIIVASLTGIQAHDGQLVLAWRSVSSDDGHMADGSLHFPVTAAPADSSAAVATPETAATAGADTAIAIPGPDPAVKDVLVAVRIVGFAATALFIGGLAFIAVIWPHGGAERRTRRLLTGSWLLGLLTVLAEIPLQAGYNALRPLSGIFDMAAVKDLLGGRLGTELTARALLWIAGSVVLASLLQRTHEAARSPGWRIGLAAVGFGLLRTTSLPGHDDTAHPLAGAIADTVHLTGVALWFGGLTVLLIGVLPRRRPEELAVVVSRYSNLALVSVTAIIAAGLVLAWHLVGSLHGLLGTSYGHLLLLKAGIVAAVLMLAQHSKAWVRHRLDVAVLLDGDRATVRPFVYSVAAETGLALAILVVAGVLVTSSPGR